MSLTRKVRADLEWLSISVSYKLRKHLQMPFQSVKVSGVPPEGPVRTIRDVRIAMRDGVRLCADIYLPRQEGTYPAIITRLPYGKGEYSSWSPVYGRFWARRGYAFVVQDVRGKFKSEGTWDPFVNEVNDGYDTIEWVSKQPWCDGNIGAIGGSYLGYTCWAAGLSGHPSLRCIAPGMTATDIYGVWAYRRGAFCLQTMASWVLPEESRKSQNYLRLDPWELPLASLGDSAGLRSSQFKEWLRHPSRDSFWDRMDLSQKLGGLSIPALHMGGWLDVFLQGTLDDWDRAKPSRSQWLVIGPNDHGSTTGLSRRAGRLSLGHDDVDRFYDRMKDFFDFWLKGVQNGFEKSPRVEYFVFGDNAWKDTDAWPPSGVKLTDFYLRSGGNANTLEGDGVLSTEPPESEPADRYTYDPRNPVEESLRSDVWSLAEHLNDRRQVEKRHDVLVYTSAALQRDSEVTGPVTASVFASITAKDTDFVVTLVDVFEDGYAQMVQEGIVRASYRLSDREPSYVEPGSTNEFRIGLRATSYVFRKGHKIRVEVTSSDFNRYERSLNTGEDHGTSTRMASCQTMILHDDAHPSRITLPLMPRP